MNETRRRKRNERKIQIARLLRYWMTWRGMTASDLMYSTGIDKSMLYGYLNARYMPTEATLSKMCRALCISRERFYNPQGVLGDGHR